MTESIPRAQRTTRRRLASNILSPVARRNSILPSTTSKRKDRRKKLAIATKIPSKDVIEILSDDDEPSTPGPPEKMQKTEDGPVRGGNDIVPIQSGETTNMISTCSTSMKKSTPKKLLEEIKRRSTDSPFSPTTLAKRARQRNGSFVSPQSNFRQEDKKPQRSLLKSLENDDPQISSIGETLVGHPPLGATSWRSRLRSNNNKSTSGIASNEVDKSIILHKRDKTPPKVDGVSAMEVKGAKETTPRLKKLMKMSYLKEKFDTKKISNGGAKNVMVKNQKVHVEVKHAGVEKKSLSGAKVDTKLNQITTQEEEIIQKDQFVNNSQDENPSSPRPLIIAPCISTRISDNADGPHEQQSQRGGSQATSTEEVDLNLQPTQPNSQTPTAESVIENDMQTQSDISMSHVEVGADAASHQQPSPVCPIPIPSATQNQNDCLLSPSNIQVSKFTRDPGDDVIQQCLPSSPTFKIVDETGGSLLSSPLTGSPNIVDRNGVQHPIPQSDTSAPIAIKDAILANISKPLPSSNEIDVPTTQVDIQTSEGDGVLQDNLPSSLSGCSSDVEDNPVPNPTSLIDNTISNDAALDSQPLPQSGSLSTIVFTDDEHQKPQSEIPNSCVDTEVIEKSVASSILESNDTLTKNEVEDSSTQIDNSTSSVIDNADEGNHHLLSLAGSACENSNDQVKEQLSQNEDPASSVIDKIDDSPPDVAMSDGCSEDIPTPILLDSTAIVNNADEREHPISVAGGSRSTSHDSQSSYFVTDGVGNTPLVDSKETNDNAPTLNSHCKPDDIKQPISPNAMAGMPKAHEDSSELAQEIDSGFQMDDDVMESLPGVEVDAVECAMEGKMQMIDEEPKNSEEGHNFAVEEPSSAVQSTLTQVASEDVVSSETHLCRIPTPSHTHLYPSKETLIAEEYGNSSESEESDTEFIPPPPSSAPPTTPPRENIAATTSVQQLEDSPLQLRAKKLPLHIYNSYLDHLSSQESISSSDDDDSSSSDDDNATPASPSSPSSPPSIVPRKQPPFVASSFSPQQEISTASSSLDVTSYSSRGSNKIPKLQPPPSKISSTFPVGFDKKEESDDDSDDEVVFLGVVHPEKPNESMNPVLRGTYQVKDTEAKWSGTWGFFETTTNAPTKFMYKCTHSIGKWSKDEPITGFYNGYFHVHEKNSNIKTQKICEKDIFIEFKLITGTIYMVEGNGKNKFGKFSFRGYYQWDEMLTLEKIYS